MSASPSRIGGPGRHPWFPSRLALLIVAAAFALGLLLFLVLWLAQRGNRDFYRAPVAPTSRAPVFEPLPAPVAGEPGDGLSGLPEPDENAPPPERPRVVERAPAPTAPAPEEARAAAIAARAAPVPVSTPAPRYPREALRRRETGVVQVRVDVGADGVPTDTEVVESSRSRELDRAALEAVRRWRFQPAVVDGRPRAGSVVVPIEFRL